MVSRLFQVFMALLIICAVAGEATAKAKRPSPSKVYSHQNNALQTLALGGFLRGPAKPEWLRRREEARRQENVFRPHSFRRGQVDSATADDVADEEGNPEAILDPEFRHR